MKRQAKRIRVGIVGAGYIADFHAKAIQAIDGVDLVGIADPNQNAARAFASVRGVPAFSSLNDMVADVELDAVHLLVPPDLHHLLATQSLDAGLNVFVEKPMCTSDEEALDLLQRSTAKGLLLRVNHSMTYGESYVALRNHIRAGDIGPVDHLCLNHFSELGFIRFGPFNNWMLREAGNALLEIGSHPISGMIDLVGEPDTIDVIADRDVVLPGGARAYRRWRIRATAGRTAVDINLDLGPGFNQRTVSARGALGTVHADLDADTCMFDRRTNSGIDFDRYYRSRGQATQVRQQARHTLADYLLSKIKLRGRGNPYEKSILDSVAAFYAEMRNPAAGDIRLTAQTGAAVVRTCRRVIDCAALKSNEPPKHVPALKVVPTILVLGGNGFIGKRLVSQLLDRGYSVRVAGRSSNPALLEENSEKLEFVRADMRSRTDVDAALDGIDFVYHLATTGAKQWADYLEQEINPTSQLAELCLSRGIKRLIYTGTIDSYYAGRGAGTITEQTQLDPKIMRRNYYARAKADGERILTDFYKSRGLPLVIARPGIVIGRGGNPFHWGVGSWRSEGMCEVWGDGDNKLPFVLVDDVASGLVRCIEVPGIEGQSFNFIDSPLLSAREYLELLQEAADMRIDIRYRSIGSFYAEDLAKWAVKVMVKHPDAQRRPSFHDWESRTQKAFFDCGRTREALSWIPVSTTEGLKEQGIEESIAPWLSARGI